eukprot:3215117-Rhodomonas_salina.1
MLSICLRACYAVCGTEIAYAAMGYQHTHLELSPMNMLRECAHVVLKGGAGVQSPRNMYQCQMGKQTMGTALSTHVIPIYRALINIHFVAKSSQLTIHVITMNSIRPIVRCMCALRSPSGTELGYAATGTPMYAYGDRVDNKVYRIITPQIPLVRNQVQIALQPPEKKPRKNLKIREIHPR